MSRTALARVAVAFVLLYAVGGAGTWWYARRTTPAAAAALWRKFVLNIVISAVVVAAIVLGDAFVGAVAAALVLVGTWEIGRLPAPSAMARAAALGAFAVVGASFLGFALSTPQANRLLVYGVVVTFDGFSQVAGQLLGRTPLAPRISPRKTVEGVAGGVVVAFLCFAVASAAPLTAARLADVLVVLAAALAGDLLASAWKRYTGVKDYGTILPYHGGVLDRFDGFLLAGAASLFLALAGRSLS